MSDARPEAQVRLQGTEVLVDGPALQSNRLRLFFSTLLGCQPTEAGGWVCPTRTRDPSELAVSVVAKLEQSGFFVRADGADTDRALQIDLARRRAFSRARDSARYLLGLDVTPADAAVVLTETDVLASLRRFGWNEQDRALLPHQRQGLMHALTAVNAANFSVPGAGKTATALSVAATHLEQGNIDTVLVIGPLSSFRPWETESRIALPGALRTLRMRGMSPQARKAQYNRAGQGDLLLLSYATAAADRAHLIALCRRTKTMLIVDESHRVKRFIGGEWSTALVEVARVAEIKMILSGTPMPQGPRDLWSQFTILWPGEELLGSRVAYDARSRSNFGSVQSAVSPFMTRTPKSALGLTELVRHSHPVELAPVQREIYDLIAARLRRAVAGTTEERERLETLRRARPIRLLQVASNPDLLNQDDGFFALPSARSEFDDVMDNLDNYRRAELPAKFAYALDLLGQLQAAGKKCVVWTSFVRNIDQFSHLVRNELGATVFSIDGRVPAADTGPDSERDVDDDNRERRIDNFLASEGFAVLVANPAACAESISLHSHCHTALYLDRTYDCARWLQSIDRIHRLGLPAGVHVEVHTLVSVRDGQPTIDGLVDASLSLKEARMQQLLEGAELSAEGLRDIDSLDTAQGDQQDLAALMAYLLGQAPPLA